MKNQFYCYRCNQYKPLEQQGRHVSPTGKLTCISCNKDIPIGSNKTKSAKRLTTTNIKFLEHKLSRY